MPSLVFFSACETAPFLRFIRNPAICWLRQLTAMPCAPTSGKNVFS